MIFGFALLVVVLMNSMNRVSAFTRFVTPLRSRGDARLFCSSGSTASEGRINKLIDLEADKVVTKLELKPGSKAVMCRCWKSAKFPLCDGAHGAHNKATGDNVAPLIITVAEA
jgi:CDGSH-type Zn-finger protein